MLRPIWLLAVGSLCGFVDGVVVLKTMKIECMTNPVFIRNATCSVRAVSWHRSNTNMECDVVGQLRNVSMHMQIFSKNDVNQYRPFLINFTRNMCDILNKKIFHQFTTILTNLMSNVSNVIHPCPFEGRLVVKNLYVDSKSLPFKPPLGVYKISFIFLEGYPYQDVGTVKVYLDVSEVRKL